MHTLLHKIVTVPKSAVKHPHAARAVSGCFDSVLLMLSELRMHWERGNDDACSTISGKLAIAADGADALLRMQQLHGSQPAHIMWGVHRT
jgi:hypothetical protein